MQQVNAEEQLEEELRRGPSGWARILRALVALGVIGGLVYVSGVHQYFFFSRTSPVIEQERLQIEVDAEVLTVPLRIFIVQNTGAYGSARSREDAKRLAEQADRIWEQAGVDLEVRALYEIERSDKEIELLYANARAFSQNLPQFDDTAINVVLVKNLQGLNGVAFSGTPLVAVADYTTVYDFRVLAHEIGHKLGLPHVAGQTRLMHQGANGFDLSVQEITTARDFAEGF